ncbi:MAG: tetratricopeptide repeat protein [Bacteroidales bacterium]|nr:tetratricopeptide repeat protein [Bacteroidales bacterium]
MKPSGQKSIRALILVMIAVVVIGILIAKNYYGNANRSVDPRIVHARELYAKYDSYAREGNFYMIFALLDSIELVYNATDHYRNSFELGVLDNNRTAALLTISMYMDSIPAAYNPFSGISTDSIVALAEIHARQAIATYVNWNADYKDRTIQQISLMIESEFMKGLENMDPDTKGKHLESRAREIEEAVRENDRRLSVCYTNLGLVFRQKGAYKDAVEQYEKALELWDRNLDAENNLNKLLNRPVRKRNIIQKLFPPDRG